MRIFFFFDVHFKTCEIIIGSLANVRMSTTALEVDFITYVSVPIV